MLQCCGKPGGTWRQRGMGRDGRKAVQMVEERHQDKDLPIIAMTADTFSDDAQRCMECGMNAHIPKPLDVNECVRVLRQYLE